MMLPHDTKHGPVCGWSRVLVDLIGETALIVGAMDGLVHGAVIATCVLAIMAAVGARLLLEDLGPGMSEYLHTGPAVTGEAER